MSRDQAAPMAPARPGAEARLAASYNALIVSDAELGRASHEALVRAHAEHGLLIRGRPLCNVLRPRFMTEARRDRLSQVSRVLYHLFERIGEVLLRSDRLLDTLHATELERAIWSIDPGFPGFTHTSRLDSFMPGDSPKFVEYNAESPASIGFSDVLTEIFRALPVMQAWRPSSDLDRLHVRQALLDLLLWAYHERGGTGTPSIAVIDWQDVMTRRDFELCAEFFVEAGIPTVIVDPRSLEYHGGKLWSGDQRVDLVYRRVLLHELLEKADEAQDLLNAYRDGAICMVNSPRSKLLHKKAVMALLSENALGIEMSDEERHIVEETIPWTRRLIEGDTTYGSETVSLVPFMLQEQHRLVLKPSDDYGGRGVILGWETEPDVWERAIQDAMGDAYVVQERVPVPRSDFPVWNGDRVTVESLLVDADPLLFRGEMGGILTRISGSALLNVSAGTGSSAPTFVVRNEGA